jgi:hypothetical protein
MVKKIMRWLPLTVFLLAACNLGQGVPGGEEATPTVDLIIPAEVPTEEGVPPATAEPSTDPAVAESIGPVTVTGEFTVGETVSIRVKRGEAVSSVNCLTVHQETDDTVVLDPPSTSGPSLDGTFDEAFTFDPPQAGTYSVSCTGVALTIDGLLEVEADSSPFTIEAKG